MIKTSTAGGSIGKIEKATRGSEIFYEVEFTKAGAKHEVRIGPGGEVLERE